MDYITEPTPAAVECRNTTGVIPHATPRGLDLLLLASAGPAVGRRLPHVYLKNDKLKVKVYLPDAQKGFYRGTRFDWAGVCGEIEFAGHKIFGPWKDTHDPTNHDDIIGPCEEFGIDKPLGYDDAKVGETFLKIGSASWRSRRRRTTTSPESTRS